MSEQINDRDADVAAVEQRVPAHPVGGGDPADPKPRRGKRPGRRTLRGNRNAVTHAIFTVDLVIPGIERPEDWNALRAGILASAAPLGESEIQLAGREAELLWRLKRVTRYELAEFCRANAGEDEFCLPETIELDKIMRYEAHLSRLYVQIKHEREVLQKQRRGEATPLARLDVQGEIEQ
jgi:hypothetical protein